MKDYRTGRVILAGTWGLLASLAVATATAAQQHGATLRGVVVDSAGEPLDAAEVELVGARVRALTAGNGSFGFEGLKNGRYWIAARRIGYRPAQMSLTLQGNETRQVRIVLATRPLNLPEVVVKAENGMYDRRMRDFLWRSRASFGGRFLTRDDIARAAPGRLGDLVARHMPFKSMWVMNEPGGWGSWHPGFDEPFTSAAFSGRRRYRPNCPPSVAVNGGGISVGWAVNDFEPDEIEAVEIYREGTQLPIEYDFPGRTVCGLVVVWLKSYANAR